MTLRYDDVVEDSGTFTQLANGDWLERGTMLDFDTGLVGDYEEVWRDTEPGAKGGGGAGARRACAEEGWAGE